MDGTRSFGAGSESVKNYTPEMDEMFQFDEMQAFVTENITDLATGNGGSFTALLGLPKNQALELLETPESAKSSPISAAGIWTDRHRGKKPPELSFSCSPTFPSNATLVERAARFSIFAAAEESPATSSDPSTSSKNSLKLKNEPADSDSIPSSSPVNSVTVPSIENQRSGKRKEGEKNKIKAPAKKSKKVEDGISENGAESKVSERLPYVHVRARRGQATDSHSLAERARREKINARMKLLQELVPGCNKISGTALVLDEIINHVQNLQRQVEFLSMRLAAVHPRLDYTLDNFLSPESGSQITGNVSGTMGVEAVSWPEIQLGGGRHPLQQQVWHVDVLPSSGWERDDNRLSVVPEASFYGPYSGNSDLVRPNQLKMEL